MRFLSIVLFSAAVSAQSLPSFEAASIRPLPPGGRIRLEGGPGTSSPGRIDYRASLKYLVMLAYRVGDSQISGPSWPDDRNFEIIATLPSGTSGPQLHEMLRKLLRERFHLELHSEQRVMPVSVLTVAKDGPKLKESLNPRPEIADDFNLPPVGPNQMELDREGYPIAPPGEGAWLLALRSGRARTRQLSASMRDLAAILTNQLGSPVTDATGLSGRYDFTLSWVAGVSVDTADSGPDLVAALQQQLGLKLETSKAPVEVFVIDRIEKDPTEN